MYQPVSQHSTFAVFCLSNLALALLSPLRLPSPATLPQEFWASPFLPLPLCPSTSAPWLSCLCLCISASAFLPLYLYFSALNWPVWLAASQPLLLPLHPGLSLHSSASLPLSMSPSAFLPLLLCFCLFSQSLPSSPLLCLYLCLCTSDFQPLHLYVPHPLLPSASLSLSLMPLGLCLYMPNPLCISTSIPRDLFVPLSLCPTASPALQLLRVDGH